MPDLTLAEAASRYTASLKEPARRQAAPEIERFVRWYRGEKMVSSMRGHDVSLYADILGPATPETTRRADYVRTFLQYLKKHGLTDTNLGTHLRLKKSGKATAHAVGAREESVELTNEGVTALRAELESLIAQRPAVREEIRKAMLDKDFRENAPLDAAKDTQGHMEARIREIESMLKRAVVVEGAAGGRVRVGTSVVVTNVRSGATSRFAIVGPTEANAADGKISSVSPVGKALLDSQVGDEVEVSVPAGTLRFRVEKIEG